MSKVELGLPLTPKSVDHFLLEILQNLNFNNYSPTDQDKVESNRQIRITDTYPGKARAYSFGAKLISEILETPLGQLPINETDNNTCAELIKSYCDIVPANIRQYIFYKVQNTPSDRGLTAFIEPRQSIVPPTAMSIISSERLPTHSTINIPLMLVVLMVFRKKDEYKLIIDHHGRFTELTSGEPEPIYRTLVTATHVMAYTIFQCMLQKKPWPTISDLENVLNSVTSNPCTQTNIDEEVKKLHELNKHDIDQRLAMAMLLNVIFAADGINPSDTNHPKYQNSMKNAFKTLANSIQSYHPLVILADHMISIGDNPLINPAQSYVELVNDMIEKGLLVISLAEFKGAKYATIEFRESSNTQNISFNNKQGVSLPLQVRLKNHLNSHRYSSWSEFLLACINNINHQNNHNIDHDNWVIPVVIENYLDNKLKTVILGVIGKCQSVFDQSPFLLDLQKANQFMKVVLHAQESQGLTRTHSPRNLYAVLGPQKTLVSTQEMQVDLSQYQVSSEIFELVDDLTRKLYPLLDNFIKSLSLEVLTISNDEKIYNTLLKTNEENKTQIINKFILEKLLIAVLQAVLDMLLSLSKNETLNNIMPDNKIRLGLSQRIIKKFLTLTLQDSSNKNKEIEKIVPTIKEILKNYPRPILTLLQIPTTKAIIGLLRNDEVANKTLVNDVLISWQLAFSQQIIKSISADNRTLPNYDQSIAESNLLATIAKTYKKQLIKLSKALEKQPQNSDLLSTRELLQIVLNNEEIENQVLAKNRDESKKVAIALLDHLKQIDQVYAWLEIFDLKIILMANDDLRSAMLIEINLDNISKILNLVALSIAATLIKSMKKEMKKNKSNEIIFDPDEIADLLKKGEFRLMTKLDLSKNISKLIKAYKIKIDSMHDDPRLLS